MSVSECVCWYCPNSRVLISASPSPLPLHPRPLPLPPPLSHLRRLNTLGAVGVAELFELGHSLTRQWLGGARNREWDAYPLGISVYIGARTPAVTDSRSNAIVPVPMPVCPQMAGATRISREAQRAGTFVAYLYMDLCPSFFYYSSNGTVSFCLCVAWGTVYIPELSRVPFDPNFVPQPSRTSQAPGSGSGWTANLTPRISAALPTGSRIDPESIG